MTDVTKELKELENLNKSVNYWKSKERVANLKLYKYGCYSCNSFAKSYAKSCRSCGAKGGHSGSFEQENLEKWYDEKLASLRGRESIESDPTENRNA